MRIALVIFRFSPDRGGEERYIERLASYLISKEHEVWIISSSFEKIEKKRGLFYHKIPVIPKIAFLKVLSFALGVNRFLAKNQFDIVHTVARTFSHLDIYQPHYGVYPAWLKENLKAKENRLTRFLSSLLKIFSPRHILYRTIERIQVNHKRCRDFIALSEMMKRDLIKYYGVPAARISLIYNGVDTDRFNPIGRDAEQTRIKEEFNLPEDLIFLFVGNDFRRKGLSPLLKSLSLLKKRPFFPSFKLLVLGNGPIEKYQRITRNLGLENYVLFLGKRKDTERFYKTADLFIYPSFYDPCPLVIFEALASGTPCITTKACGSGELIQDNREGFIISSPEEIEVLAEKISAFANQEFRVLASSMAEKRGREFTWEKSFSQVLRLYQHILVEKEEKTDFRLIPHKGIWINRDYLDVTRNDGLENWQRIMNTRLEVKRSYKGKRETGKIVFSENRHEFYMKRHYPLTFKDIVKELIKLSNPFFSAVHEGKAMILFKKLGLPSLKPIAFGGRGIFFFKGSFLITEELKGYESLETFIPSYFELPLRGERLKEKRILIQKLAQFTKEMHYNGIAHRDLYLCHFLIKKNSPSYREPDLSLIDLHRLKIKKRLSKRWKIKDLASLLYSSFGYPVTRTDLFRFALVYFGISHVKELSRSQMNLLGDVRRKSDRIKRHTGKSIMRGETL